MLFFKALVYGFSSSLPHTKACVRGKAIVDPSPPLSLRVEPDIRYLDYPAPVCPIYIGSYRISPEISPDIRLLDYPASVCQISVGSHRI